MAIPVLITSAFAARLFFMPILLVTNWDGFALGALLAWLLGAPGASTQRGRGWAWGLAALAAVTLSYPLWRAHVEVLLQNGWPTLWEKLAFSINASRLFGLYFAVVGLTVICAGQSWLRPLRHPVLVYLGTISYGLYLYHAPLYVVISASHYDITCHDSMALDALKLAVVFAVAILSWEFFEKPILRLKDRFPYSRGESVRRPHMALGSRDKEQTQRGADSHSPVFR